jgi:hypothetical protein
MQDLHLLERGLPLCSKTYHFGTDVTGYCGRDAVNGGRVALPSGMEDEPKGECACEFTL